MSIENMGDYPEIPEKVNTDVLGPIVHGFKKPKYTVLTAREAARNHPAYLSAAFEAASMLYPNDLEMRTAFLNGTELITSIQRQEKLAKEVSCLVFGDSNPVGGDVALGQPLEDA